MHSELFSCGSCFKEYNQVERIPRILPPCGHTLCSICLQNFTENGNQIKCPLDNGVFPCPQGVQSLQINQKIMQLVDDKSILEFCSIHNEEIISVCTLDKCKVCRRCVHSAAHKGHETKSIKQSQQEGKIKKEGLEELLKLYETRKTSITTFAAEEKEALVKIIIDKFEIAKDILAKKQESLISIVNLFFATEKEKMVNTYINDSSSAKDIEQRILDLSSKSITTGFIEALIQEPPQFTGDIDYESLGKHTLGFNEKLGEAIDSFNNFISSQVQQFKFVLFIDNPSEKVHDTYMEDPNGPRVFESKVFLALENDNKVLKISAHDPLNNTDSSTIGWEQLKEVKQVDLRFSKNKDSAEIMQELGTMWTHLTQVSGVKVSFEGKDIDGVSLFDFCSSDFWATKDINSFAFELKHYSGDELPLLKLLNDVLPKMTELRKISLCLDKTKLSDESFEAFGKNMTAIAPHLETFSLSLHSTVLSDASLIKVFKPMENLKNFEMDLSSTNITDKAIEMFNKQTLNSMKNLQTFKMNLSSTSVTNQSVSHLFIDMKNVRVFLLSLANTDVSTRSIKVFAKKTMPTLTQLERFMLDLSFTQVKDDQIPQLLNSLRSY